MRYEDWDVLLFPASQGNGNIVPIKEFRTACCAIQEVTSGVSDVTLSPPTPLMTCFIPSLSHGAPFSVSLHSWVQRPMFKRLPGQYDSAMWQIKVIVDGVCVNTHQFNQDSFWPLVLSIDGSDAQPKPMAFPKFYTSVVSEREWDPVDETGRIKVELSELLYAAKEDGDSWDCTKVNHVYFNFQPAPMDILKRTEIAWPNNNTFKNPKLCSAGHVVSGRLPTSEQFNNHYRNPSAGSGYHSSPHGYAGLSTRSTSAYSYLSQSAMPAPPLLPQHQVNGPLMQVRLPSDQLNRIIGALGKDPTLSLPAGAASDLDHSIESHNDAHSHSAGLPNIQPAPAKLESTDRRAQVATDTSMHTGCNEFPSCIAEDIDGNITHLTPASIVRGRKEGEADLENRNFQSTILDTEHDAEHGGENITTSEVTNVSDTTKKANGNKKRVRSTNVFANGSPSEPARKLRTRTLGVLTEAD